MPPLSSIKTGIERRDALKAMAASMAALMAGCARPAEDIVPYVNMPERMVPGEVLRFATTVALAGYGRGAVALTHEGRPTKLEGNPHHPASLGGSDVFLEASVLSLYDPDRSQAVRAAEMPVATWQDFERQLVAVRNRLFQKQGAGLRILTGRITSPTLLRQMKALFALYPHARWHRYEPVNDDNALAGSMLAFGQRFTMRPHLDEANVIWTIGADPIGPGPDQPRFAHDFAKVRLARGHQASLSRLYVTESVLSLTGANADHRLALSPPALRNFACAVASRCGLDVPHSGLDSDARLFADALAADLKAGRALVLAGDEQPPEIHALAYVLNDRLKAPVDYIAPVDPAAQGHAQSLSALAEDLSAGSVGALFIVGANPVYDSALPFGKLIRKAEFSVHLSCYDDETSAVCKWHLPQTHSFEGWSDLRAPDGTASIVQPLITPLFDTRDAHALIGMLTGNVRPSRQLVRETWAAHGSASDSWWRGVLEKGVIDGSAAAHVKGLSPRLPAMRTLNPAPEFALVVRPDPSIFDGSVANNAWLQECPKPLTFAVWGNAFSLSPADAARLNLKDGDTLRATAGDVAVEGPLEIHKDQASGTVGTTLGYGRDLAGAIGKSIGFRAVDLAAAAAHHNVSLSAADGDRPIYHAHRMAELDGDRDELYPTLDLLDLARTNRLEAAEEPPSMISHPHAGDGYAWAMVIDASACIGCNACVISCQAENNVAVVGPEEIAMGREMHWLRIDAYETTEAGAPAGFQPVPCMHCEKAPCEPVCPVEASIHDVEGLNVQVYNRCIGTRFCQSNCPYKVRRFNWFGYTDGQEYADLGAGLIAAQRNPDVTVRTRGVMEKCTYCVQRISRARHKAEEENRTIRAGEVVTACQAACPTNAIHFGNLENPDEDVVRLRNDPRHYTLLRKLGTRPRTTYLAKLTNPNSKLRGGKA